MFLSRPMETNVWLSELNIKSRMAFALSEKVLNSVPLATSHTSTALLSEFRMATNCPSGLNFMVVQSVSSSRGSSLRLRALYNQIPADPVIARMLPFGDQAICRSVPLPYRANPLIWAAFSGEIIAVEGNGVGVLCPCACVFIEPELIKMATNTTIHKLDSPLRRAIRRMALL